MKLNRALRAGLIGLMACAAIQVPIHAQESASTAASEPPAPAAVLVTVAPNRPPCDDVYASAGQNCYGTRATTHSFPVPLQSLLWFPQQPSDRVSWVFVGPVVVRPANLARALWLQIDAGDPGEYQLTAGLDEQATHAAMKPGVWTSVQIPLEQRFWVRIEPTTGSP